MAQRRKTEVSVTNNNQSDFNSEFQNVASEVAKLYQKALNMQPVSFDAGRKHSLVREFINPNFNFHFLFCLFQFHWIY